MANYTIDKFSYGGNTYNFDKDTFVVNVGVDSDFTEVNSVDKTVTEIYTALQASKNIIAIISNGNFNNIVPLVYATSNECEFSQTTINSTDFIADASTYFLHGGFEVGDSDIWSIELVYGSPLLRNQIYSATCPTAAGTAAKVATIVGNTDYKLTTGVCVAVTFQYGNSATTPTLNVNSGGAKNIVVPTAVATLTSGNGTTYNTWGPYETIIFTYNGSQWVSSGSARSIYNAYALANSKGSGTITGVSVNGTSVATSGVANITSIPSSIVSGLGAAASKAVDSTIADESTSTNLPTSAAVAAFVEDKGYVTTDTTYSAGTGLSLSGTVFNHENSITAGTAGGTAATSGASISIPYVTYDSEGHISAAGTRTHTVTGFAASSHSHGDISSTGDITTTATIASGDRLVINDESASKVTSSSITFGSSTTTYLRNDGTWGTPTGGSQILSGTTAPTSSIGNDGDVYLLLNGTSAGSIVYSVLTT